MKEIKIDELKINPCSLIGNEWMVISAGNEKEFNMMTASWGHIGSLWGQGLYGRPTTEIFVRASRYTDKFIDENECYTLSFFSKEYQKDLLYLGSHSGKNENKLLKTKLNVEFIDGLPCYKEAKLTIICKKIYKGKIEKEGFIDKQIIKNFYEGNSIYNENSLHNVYVGEILKIFINE